MIKQQVAFGLTPADQQHSIFFFTMLTCKPLVIDIVKNVNIMNKYGAVGIKQRCSLLQSATRIEQLFTLITELHQ